jgi:uncharacterized phiE125 gp8 family phage protein
MQPFPRKAGPPAAEPVTLAEALAHLREVADGGENDAVITRLITVARAACEEHTERTLITTPWVLKLDAFTDAIELHHPPIIAVTAVRYKDTEGAEQTIDSADYVLDSASEPGWLVPAPGTSWPATQTGAVNTVTIEYTAGYGATAAAVPAPLKHWILCAIQHMHDERGWDVPDDFARGLIRPFRLLGV